MTQDIDPITHQIGGDTFHLPFVVPNYDDENQDRKDLSGADIQWALIDDDGSAALSHEDEGVTITITSPTDGEFRVEIGADVTREMNDVYKEWIRIYTAGGQRQTWTADATILKDKLDLPR